MSAAASKLRFAGLLAATLASPSFSSAQDAPVARIDSRTSFRGLGFFDQSDDLYAGRSEVSFIPRLELFLPWRARIETSVELRGDAVDDSRNRVYPFRGFVDLTFGPWDVRAGRQIVRTGKVDGIRPTDYFRKRNFTDFLYFDEEPIDAARIDYYTGDWILTGVLAPYFQPDIFPLDPRNRWTAPLLPPAPEEGPTLDYELSSASRPRGVDSSEVGLWAGRRTGGIDWSASYFYGHDRIPSSYEIRLAEEAAETVTVELLPQYRRLHVVGLDWETTMGSFGFRGEASHTRYDDASPASGTIADPFTMFALGVDRTFTRIVGSDDLYVNVQYQFDSGRTDETTAELPELENPFRHFFRHAVTSLLEYRFDPYRSILTRVFWNPSDDDYVVQSEFSWKPWDGWTWILGVDVVGGPSDSFFGTYRANDRARTTLTFDWDMWEHRPEPAPEPLPFPDLELESTAWVGGEWIAVIDGRVIKRGDTVEGTKVVSIADGSVELEMDGRPFSLVLVEKE